MFFKKKEKKNSNIKTKKIRNSVRSVHIDGTEWDYKIGNHYINIWNPKGKRINISICDLFPYRVDISEMRYNKSLCIEPSDIKDYIIKELIKD